MSRPPCHRHHLPCIMQVLAASLPRTCECRNCCRNSLTPAFLCCATNAAWSNAKPWALQRVEQAWLFNRQLQLPRTFARGPEGCHTPQQAAALANVNFPPRHRPSWQAHLMMSSPWPFLPFFAAGPRGDPGSGWMKRRYLPTCVQRAWHAEGFPHLRHIQLISACTHTGHIPVHTIACQ